MSEKNKLDTHCDVTIAADVTNVNDITNAANVNDVTNVDDVTNVSTNTTEIKSLDINDEKLSLFYFKVLDNNQEYVMHSLKQSSVKKFIPLFADMLTNNRPDTLNKAIQIEPFKVHDNCKLNSMYIINTSEQYKLIVDYVSYWETRSDEESYVDPNTQQSGYIYQLLVKFDLNLLNTYVDTYLMNKKFPSLAVKKYARITALNPLLKCVDGYLRMDGLSNKIYTYIAEIIRTCGIIDITDMYLTDYFQELQLPALTKWRNENPELYHTDFDTTDSNTK